MRIAFLLSFYFISTCLFAQQTHPNVVDSLLNGNAISQEKLVDISAADTLINLKAADSLLNFSASDSLLNLEPIDSLRGTIGKVESGIQTINDSISRATQLPDSLLPDKLLAPVTNKVDTVKLKLNAFADSIKSKVALPDSLKKLVPDEVNVLNNKDIPDLDIEPLEEVKQVDGLSGIGEIKELEKIGELKEVGNVDQLGDVKQLKEIEEIETITEKAGELEISSKAEDISGTAENEVKNLKQFKALEEQKGDLGQYQKDFGADSEDFYKEKAVSTGKEVAKNHFAGQQEKLQAAQEKLAELKRKYPEGISSINDLPKRFSNTMKGKPFKERFLMGLTVQVLPDQTPNIDLSPFVAYKISGRWSAGVGGSYRLVTRDNWRGLDQRGTVYGFRVISEFKIYKGFFAHVDYEQMKVAIGDSLYAKPQSELSKRGWVDGLMVGVGKDYKIAKYVRGNMQVLYNFMYDVNSPYRDKVMIRFGFSFQLKDKVKKPVISESEKDEFLKENRKKGVKKGKTFLREKGRF